MTFSTARKLTDFNAATSSPDDIGMASSTKFVFDAKRAARLLPKGQTLSSDPKQQDLINETTASDPRMLREAAKSAASFRTLQEWDGYVVSKGNNVVVARLTDITNRGGKDAEEIDIPFDELTEDQIDRIEPGSLFRWSIGYQRSVAGQKTRVSRIILRQLPRWRPSQIKLAEEEAKEIARSIEWQ